MKNSEYALNLLLEAYRHEDTSRDDSNIHVSNLLDFCPRKIALLVRHKIPFHTKRFIPLPTGVTFDIGNAIQSMLIKRYRKTGKLIGTWECAKCELSFFGLDTSCPHCDSKLLIYKDTTILLNKFGVPVVGNIDMLLLSDSEKYIIINEIKSIKPEGFDKLKDKAELLHRRQASLYMWMLLEGASIVCDTYNIDLTKYTMDINNGVVIYCCKTQKPEPLKSCDIIFDDKIIEVIEEKLNKVKKFTTDNKIPKPICSQQDDTMAKNCSVRLQCFKNRRG